jgi:hypothetical protein
VGRLVLRKEVPILLERGVDLGLLGLHWLIFAVEFFRFDLCFDLGVVESGNALLHSLNLQVDFLPFHVHAAEYFIELFQRLVLGDFDTGFRTAAAAVNAEADDKARPSRTTSFLMEMCPFVTVFFFFARERHEHDPDPGANVPEAASLALRS